MDSSTTDHLGFDILCRVVGRPSRGKRRSTPARNPRVTDRIRISNRRVDILDPNPQNFGDLLRQQFSGPVRSAAGSHRSRPRRPPRRPIRSESLFVGRHHRMVGNRLRIVLAQQSDKPRSYSAQSVSGSYCWRLSCVAVASPPVVDCRWRRSRCLVARHWMDGMRSAWCGAVPESW